MKPILIAEDELRVASFLAKGLKKNGFVTVVAEDGQKAIDLATSDNFALLLLDLGLPVKDGFTVLEELRSQNTKIPIIVVTALSDEKIYQQVISQGADDYIQKPFSFQVLLAKIKSYS
ncbi:MAG: response regulator transcription factor [Pleurocapsa sp.]